MGSHKAKPFTNMMGEKQASGGSTDNEGLDLIVKTTECLEGVAYRGKIFSGREREEKDGRRKKTYWGFGK